MKVMILFLTLSVILIASLGIGGAKSEKILPYPIFQNTLDNGLKQIIEAYKSERNA